MKKKMVLVVLVCLILAFGNLPVYAASEGGVSVIEDSIKAIAPMSLYISRTNTLLSISSSHQATCTANITCYPGSFDVIWIFMYLEIYSNGSWTTYSSWYQSFTTATVSMQRTTFTPPGYSYRVRASYYVYNGDDSEHTTGYSSVIYH